jgi:hypothetical protein
MFGWPLYITAANTKEFELGEIPDKDVKGLIGSVPDQEEAGLLISLILSVCK